MPPTNHFAKGGFQSSTFFQGVNQETCSFAICAQKRSGSARAELAVRGDVLLAPVRAASRTPRRGLKRASPSAGIRCRPWGTCLLGSDRVGVGGLSGTALRRPSTRFGIDAVRFSCPSSVTTTSSSMRTPMPRRCAGAFSSRRGDVEARLDGEAPCRARAGAACRRRGRRRRRARRGRASGWCGACRRACRPRSGSARRRRPRAAPSSTRPSTSARSAASCTRGSVLPGSRSRRAPPAAPRAPPRRRRAPAR